jgi:predicted anti-sigma-YlaC factor YlaD
VAGQDEMTCQELVELVTEYFEGTLPAVDVTRFEEHLGECEACLAYLDQMRATIASLGRLEASALPAAARDGLLAAFRDWKRASVR